MGGGPSPCLKKTRYLFLFYPPQWNPWGSNWIFIFFQFLRNEVFGGGGEIIIYIIYIFWPSPCRIGYISLDAFALELLRA